MTLRRAAHLVPMGVMLIVGAAGCAAGGDSAAPTASPPDATADLVELDGVRFDVRRDPG